jgi:hypothetical protein
VPTFFYYRFHITAPAFQSTGTERHLEIFQVSGIELHGGFFAPSSVDPGLNAKQLRIGIEAALGEIYRWLKIAIIMDRCF